MPGTWATRIVWRTCFQEPRHLCLDGLGGQANTQRSTISVNFIIQRHRIRVLSSVIMETVRATPIPRRRCGGVLPEGSGAERQRCD